MACLVRDMINNISSRLREIVDLDEYLWRVQISMTVRRTMYRKRGWSSDEYIIDTYRSRIMETRRAIKSECEKMIDDIPILYSAMGVSDMPLMYVLSVITRVDIVKADSPAQVWRYFGYGITDGRSDTFRARMGSDVHFSSAARRWAGRLALFVSRKHGPYRDVWEKQIVYLRGRGIPEGALKLRARRYVFKLWLKHLWLVWRRQEKLPVGAPHPDDTTHLAAEFGWR